MVQPPVSEIPVLVVGAGPVGLVMALTLLKNNISVRIIDKEPKYHVGQRGAGMQPRSLELFRFLGVLPDIEKNAESIKPMCIWKMPGGTEREKVFEMAPQEAPTPWAPHRNPLLIGQDHYEELLREHLAKHGVHVELNTALVGLEQDSDGVTAQVVQHDKDGNPRTETIHAQYLVGADGAKGVVRKLLGLPFVGETWNTHPWLTADVYLTGLDADHWHSFGDSIGGDSMFVTIRPTEYPGLFMIVGGGKDLDPEAFHDDKEAISRFLREATHRTDIEVTKVKCTSAFRPNIRMVDKFGEGRVFVAGDAAHVHSPTGGQGMNSGVQDSFNLAWKLAHVLKHNSPLSLLESYTAERLPVIREMLVRTTSTLTKTIQYRAGKGDNSAWKRPKYFHMLGVNHRWSDIVVDEQPVLGTREELEENAYGMEDSQVLRAGDRAPDAPELVNVDGMKTALFDLFTPAKHTLLLFISEPREAEDVITVIKDLPVGAFQTIVILPQGTAEVKHTPSIDLTVVDHQGHAYTNYPPARDGYRFIIVRPDGTVGGIVKGAEGMRHYIKNVFTV